MDRHVSDLTLCLLPLWLGGCLILPIPNKEKAVDESRQMILPQQTAFLRPGVTGREEVLLRLGEPDHRWKDDRCFCYGWATSNLSLLVAVSAGYGGGGAGVHEFTELHYLLLEFDASGRLLRHEARGASGFRNATKYVDELVKNW